MRKEIYHKRKLFTRAKVCASFLSKSIGLMFSKKLKEGESLLLETSQPLTMLFVFYHIDLVFLDRKGEIVGIIKAKPFSPYVSSKKDYSFVLELPRGKADSLRKGEVLEMFKNKG